ncbi:putative aminotransferase [Aspergillus novofumigatus IBT 16806]|uniref:Putative aminotransferase n=1 Tax=Aspergillus novofumigatus (strain IBT 16806) TaxID=1392255 RepID=A0A2I1CF23_ASPN1|nr:putative aminotransferase [Aspergillus novofumigatus IBT 16806]PKX96237.1 putative aminotransferase [Aspergillus novofumigatus IBT 16806]
MVKLDTFEIDHWILTRSPGARHNLAHSYSLPVTIQELGSLGTDPAEHVDNPLATTLSLPMNYGPSFTGLEKLRMKIAALYASESEAVVSPSNIITTPGASLANFIVFFALIGPGDHVIVQYPTYPQLYSLPSCLGAEVSLWQASEDNHWQLDLEELERLIQPNTKMIVLNNPQNPTGAIITKSNLGKIVDLARRHSITKSVVTCSLSKTFSLAGIRVGWLASHSSSILDLCLNARSYTVITVSQIDEQIAAMALEPVRLRELTKRNLGLAKHNLEIVQSFIDRHSSVCEWVRPVAGPVGFVKFSRNGVPIDDVEFCILLLEKKGVLLVPGRKCFGEMFKGYVRLGFGQSTRALEAALEALAAFISEDYDAVPLAERK